jgi:THO complex subunit 2
MGVLSDLFRLHQSEEAWKKHNKKGGTILPGFQRAWTGKEDLEESDLLTWPEFRMLNKKWHKKLAGVNDLLQLTGGFALSDHRIDIVAVPILR